MLGRLDRFQDAVPLLLRAAVGVVVLAHAQHTVFSGGMARHVDLVTRTLHLPWPVAYLSAYAELLGAGLLLLGLFTRYAGLTLAVILGVAVTRVHWAYGLRGPGGFELPLVLCAGALALVFLGGGWLSLDRHLLREG
ncbi:MAG TPA: DoxX family protein [Candidatus Polarisedimenticolaceae bacterium]|nr:DoxX family protein [Candidatus Polarisedimenticolaceae bacterium]